MSAQKLLRYLQKDVSIWSRWGLISKPMSLASSFFLPPDLAIVALTILPNNKALMLTVLF
jgi:hypothetical protein